MNVTMINYFRKMFRREKKEVPVESPITYSPTIGTSPPTAGTFSTTGISIDFSSPYRRYILQKKLALFVMREQDHNKNGYPFYIGFFNNEQTDGKLFVIILEKHKEKLSIREKVMEPACGYRTLLNVFCVYDINTPISEIVSNYLEFSQLKKYTDVTKHIYLDCNNAEHIFRNSQTFFEEKSLEEMIRNYLDNSDIMVKPAQTD